MNIDEPIIESITITSFTVKWLPPAISGGCPITSYELYRDDGVGSEVNVQIDPDSFASRLLPYQYRVELNSMTGMPIHIKIKALNAAGSTISKSSLFVLSDVPGKPYPAPAVVKSQTSTSMITVDFTNNNSDDGGSDITSVQLWMDDGKQGPFHLIYQTISTTTLYTIRNGIEQGL